MQTSRRNFAKLLLASALAPAPFLQAKPAEATRPDWIKIAPSPIQLDPKIYQRFSSQNIAFNVVSRELGQPWFVPYEANLAKYNAENKLCMDAPADPENPELDIRSSNAFRFAMDCFDNITGGGTGRENSGAPYRHWNAQDIPKKLYENPAPGTATDFSKQIKIVAKMSGADLVGIAPLDHNYVYASTQRNPHTPDQPKIQDIVFKNVKYPEETETELIIPESVNMAIVFASEMNSLFIQTSPAPLSTVPNSAGYGRQGITAYLLAQYIRAMGYVAIPCKNDTVLAVPLAIEAGLGQFGRHGLLLTPEFGACVRLGVVLTNMPLNRDQPINFGIDDFCDGCLRCALKCPVQAITSGPKTWQGLNECNNSGTYKWYNNVKKCLQYWIDNGHSCSTCLGVCPHTKAAILNNKIVNGVITKAETPNPYWPKTTLRRTEKNIWNAQFAAYGIMDLDPN